MVLVRRELYELRTELKDLVLGQVGTLDAHAGGNLAAT